MQLDKSTSSTSHPLTSTSTSSTYLAIDNSTNSTGCWPLSCNCFFNSATCCCSVFFSSSMCFSSSFNVPVNCTPFSDLMLLRNSS